MSTTSRILLVRHGPSSYQYDRRWLNARHVREFETGYNAAGILEDDAPPPHLVAAAASAQIIVASDLPRAIASARRIAPGRDFAVSPLLRELDVETPDWIIFPLPMIAWDAIYHLQWTLRLMRRTNHEHVRRAVEAADWLASHTMGNATVVTVTHGGFRRLLAARLAATGWRADPGKQTYENWSIWSFTLGE